MFSNNLKERFIGTFKSFSLYITLITNFLITTNYYRLTNHAEIKYQLILYSFFVNFFILFTIFFIIKNKYLRGFIVFVFLLANFFDFMSYVTTKIILSQRVIQAILETNFDETHEFLFHFLNIHIFSYIVFSVSLFYILFRVLRNLKKSNKKQIKTSNNKISKILVSLVIISFLFVIKTFFYFGSYTLYEMIPLTRLLNDSYISIKQVKKYKTIKDEFEKLNVEINLDKQNSIENIVLIIGESTSRNHMGLYGYKINNNPALISQEKEGNLFKFNDVVSPHSQTIPSIEKMLTLKNYETTEPWYQTPNIISIMKNSGFNTYWFSNQGRKGVFSNIGYAFSTLADINIFNEDFYSIGINQPKPYDIDLIEIAKNNIKNLDDKQNNNIKNFVIFHLAGTHYEYSDRYSKDFKKYETSYIDKKLNSSQKKSISTYDTAVLYNDYVVSEIHNLFKDTNSIIIYASDHGEELYEKRKFEGHTEGNPSKYMLEIPFTIYVTDKFKENNSQILNNIKNSLNKKYMTDDLPHTILDILGIQITDFDETRSLININFNEERKRIFQGRDYDEYWKMKE